MRDYRERLVPSAGFFIALLLLIPAIVLVFAPINPTLGFILAPALYLVFGAISIVASPVVAVDSTRLRAGRASIELGYLTSPSVIVGADAIAARGPSLDARAYLCIRGSLPLVRIEINDQADPCPYWLISSRHPDSLAQAIAERATTR